ncbi:MAG: hypothetical protein C3F15_17855 [Holophagae bacterium]|nr:MAG: hypothetical protein C3F15_17855 [Holophagae bacterium]
MTGPRLLGAAAALAVGLACAPQPQPGIDLIGLLPDASRLAGWRVVEGPVAYGPERLYDYLDGGAERYLGYGFRQLVHIRYQLGEDPLACVTLDLYDMGGAPGAFGLFRSALPPDATAQPWCAEAYSSGTVAAAWRASLYVHGEADDGRPELLATLSAFVGEICGRAPGETVLPAFLAPLPAEGLVPQSERWVAADLFGHAFLAGGVTAAYRLDGHEARLFYSDLGGGEAAEQALEKLRAHWRGQAAVEELPSPGRGGFRYSDEKLGSGSAVTAGRFVAGVHCDAPDLPVVAQQRLLAALLDGLAAR